MSSILWTKCVHGVLYFLLPQLLVHFISAQLHEFSTATVSTSWVINSTEDFSSSFDGSMVNVILRRGASRPQFGCGFFCNGTCDTYLFAIFYLDDNFVDPCPQVVWSANRNHPVRMKATLKLTSHGDLVLENDDGSKVWSTNTSGKSVAGLNLTDTGNLVLFDHNNETVWQSFDHPTDCLLPGQKLMAGQKLTPSVSLTNWTELGFFSISVSGDRGLFASAGYNPPQVYSQFMNDDMDMSGFKYLRYANGNLSLFYQYPRSGEPYAQMSIPTNASSAQYVRFGSDGHLRAYEWRTEGWTEVADLLTEIHRNDLARLTYGNDPVTETYGNCLYPTVCGNYGICSNNGEHCICPQSNNEYFQPVKYSQPNLGCHEITPLSCEVSQYHTFLELQGTSYITFLMSFQYTSNAIQNAQVDYMSDVTLDQCKEVCSLNCSCKAIFFGSTLHSTMGHCYLPSQIFSLMSINDDSTLSNPAAYVKVQKADVKVQNASSVVPQRKERSQIPMIIGFSIGSFAVLLISTGIATLLVRKKRNADEADEDYLAQVPGMLTRFSYQDLKVMTGNFSKVLGKGGFGSVFEGTQVDGTKIAVKQLNGFDQVKQSFLAEVEAIGSIHHVNLVRLFGFCADKFHRLLVYEYMSNGSLDKWIFQQNPEFVLDWHQRRKIILDVAKGLTYLHEDCWQKIIHLDIKPQNVLLDDNFNAKISDFGLSKLIDRDQSKVVTKMRGTVGYLAPEWLSSVITEKVDIYSFGVVVLEILCGRRNLDRSQPEERTHLLKVFEKKAEEDRLLDLIDNRSEDMQLHGAEILNLMKIAAWCLQSNYAERPSMSAVVNVLEGVSGIENAIDYNLSNPAFSQISLEGTPLMHSVLSGPR